MAKATGKDKDMNVKGMIAEAMWMAETVRAFRFQAESLAYEDQFGTHVPLRRPLDTSRKHVPENVSATDRTRASVGFQFADGYADRSRSHE